MHCCLAVKPLCVSKCSCVSVMPHSYRIHESRPIEIDDPVVCLVFVTRLRPAKMAERIDVLLGVETLWHPWNSVSDGSFDFPMYSMRPSPNYFVHLLYSMQFSAHHFWTASIRDAGLAIQKSCAFGFPGLYTCIVVWNKEPVRLYAFEMQLFSRRF